MVALPVYTRSESRLVISIPSLIFPRIVGEACMALWHSDTLALCHYGTLALCHYGTLALW